MITPLPTRTRRSQHTRPLFAGLALAGLLLVCALRQSSHRNGASAVTAPEEKKFTVMPLRFGINPSVTTSGGSVSFSPDIALEGGWFGWEKETYASYGGGEEESNVAGPGEVGERGAQAQGELLAVNEKPLGETAALVGGGITATASAVDHAAASTLLATWEAPGKVVGAEVWAANEVASATFGPPIGLVSTVAGTVSAQIFTSDPPPLPPPQSPPLPPASPPPPRPPPGPPPSLPPPSAPASNNWWG
mmetsp:Transcript_34615/g.103100  ORF Transcript_34615/g.103100 Transcript_34615/m.103100 type:complete len:248 (-) Transcript_34615:295-1038(-)